MPSKFAGMTAESFKTAGFRAVPGAIVRRSAYVAPGVVLMPSFVNLGAYVGEGTMVDTWATVGSCAQIGKNVHLSGGVGIGGVLEPLQANPTIIEDNCFIGARSEVVEGVIVGEGSVLSMGVYIGASTKIVDRATGKIHDRQGAALLGGGVGHAAGQAVPQRRAGPRPLLRRDRQDRGRADALQDQHQRAAARLARWPRRMQNRRALDPAKVIDTIAALHRRISERFPGAGLAAVCSELHAIAQENSARARQISHRNLPLRVAIFVLLAAGAAGLAWIAQLIYLFPRSADNVYSVLQGLEAAANLVVLLGAAIFFLFRDRAELEAARCAAGPARAALHRARHRHAPAHQGSERWSLRVGRQDAHPRRRARCRRFEVTRYLDYCSEMVSLTVQGRRAVRAGLSRPGRDRGGERYRARCRRAVAEDLAEDHDPAQFCCIAACRPLAAQPSAGGGEVPTAPAPTAT